MLHSVHFSISIYLITCLPAPIEQKCFEWNINRDLSLETTPSNLTKTASKTIKTSPKLTPMKELSKQVKKQELDVVKTDIQPPHYMESDTEKIYYKTNSEYNIQVNDLFFQPTGTFQIPYLFEVNDMNKDIDSNDLEQKKTQEKILKKVTSKTTKDTVKESEEFAGYSSVRNERSSISSDQKLKIDM